MLGIFLMSFLIARGGEMIRMMVDVLLLSEGLGWDNSWVLCRPTFPGLHVLN